MMREQEIDKNFSGRLNILRAGVLGANDGYLVNMRKQFLH